MIGGVLSTLTTPDTAALRLPPVPPSTAVSDVPYVPSASCVVSTQMLPSNAVGDGCSRVPTPACAWDCAPPTRYSTCATPRPVSRAENAPHSVPRCHRPVAGSPVDQTTLGGVTSRTVSCTEFTATMLSLSLRTARAGTAPSVTSVTATAVAPFPVVTVATDPAAERSRCPSIQRPPIRLRRRAETVCCLVR